MCLNFIRAVFYFQIFRLKCVNLSSPIRATGNMYLPLVIGFVALTVAKPHTSFQYRDIKLGQPDSTLSASPCGLHLVSLA